jgi:6-pyruvoyltetrahydropterin/6-carboxytetrahydropterin synthase
MGLVYLTRRACFSAAHRLHSNELSPEENKRTFGPCNSLNGHGHNYTLEVTVKGQPDPKSGMIINLTTLKEVMDRTVILPMDHKNLNVDVPALSNVNPTAENLVVVIWNLLEKELPKGILHEVRLRETENNVSLYRGE